MKRPLHYVTATLLISLLAACSGGGGGPSSHSSSGSGSGSESGSDTGSGSSISGYPIHAAMNSLIINGEHYTCTMQFSFTTNGGAHSASGPCTHELTPAAAATFENQAALSNINTDSSSLTDEFGHTTSTSDVSTFYYDSNYNLLATANTDGSFSVVTESHELPITAVVGDSGQTDSQSTYEDSTKAVLQNTSTGSYVIEADSDTSVILHTTMRMFDTQGTLNQTEDTRYRIDKNGNTSFVSSDVTVPDGSFTIHVTAQ